MTDAPRWDVRLSRTGVSLAARARLADTFWSRAVGLLGTDALPDGEGLLIVPCSSVHGIGMRYAFDVAYLDREGLVLEVTHAMRPGSIGRPVRNARAVLELPAGTLAAHDVRPGDRLDGLPPL